MKQTKLILTRTALLLFVMLLAQTAWAEQYSLNTHEVTLKLGDQTVTLTEADNGLAKDKSIQVVYTGEAFEPTVEALSCYVNNSQNLADIKNDIKSITYKYNTYPKVHNGGDGDEYNASITITVEKKNLHNESITKYFIIKKAPAVTVSAELIATKRVYDGNVLSTDEVKFNYTDLLANHEVTGVTLGFLPANSGNADNYSILVSEESEGSAKIMLGETDVTDCFEGLTLSNGSLTVEQKPITITAQNQGFFVGGSIATTVDKAAEINTETPLAEGDKLTGITLKVYTKSETPGEVQNVSEAHADSYTIKPSSAVIKDGETDDANDVTANYDITYVDGGLTISPEGVIVTLIGKNQTIDYDGEKHSVSGYEVVSTTYSESNAVEYLADYFHYEIDEVEATPKAESNEDGDAGTYYMELNAENFVNEEEDFTVTFVVAVDGYLTINPIDATVTIVGNNNTTVFDNGEHSVSGYTATASTPLYKVTKENDDDVLDFTFDGKAEAKRTDAGTTNMGLTKDDFANVSKNFANVTFNVTDGYQTITPLAVTVTINGNHNGYEFDNQEHSVSGYEVEISDPLYTEADFTFSGTAEAKRTETGTTYMGLKAGQFKNDNDNFTVTFNVTDGFMNITYHIASFADDADNSTIISNIVLARGGMSDVILADRTLYKDGAWNTICLPFDVTIAGSPLAGADVRELSNASFADGELNLEFSAVTAIKAGVPYIIKWASGSNISEPTFEGVSLSTELKDKAISLGDGKSVTFKGTYAPVAYAETNKSVLLVGEESTLYYPEAGAYTNAQRAYFQLEGLEVGTVESNAIGLRFGDATGIINVLTPAADAVYYDLSGRCIKGQPTETGIYIVNGKKVVIK